MRLPATLGGLLLPTPSSSIRLHQRVSEVRSTGGQCWKKVPSAKCWSGFSVHVATTASPESRNACGDVAERPVGGRAVQDYTRNPMKFRRPWRCKPRLSLAGSRTSALFRVDSVIGTKRLPIAALCGYITQCSWGKLNCPSVSRSGTPCGSF